MSYSQHYVCTLDEAKELVERHQRYWVSNCGCRESHGGCSRSRVDVCLQFGDVTAAGSGHREITREQVESILEEAGSKLLVPRPFRDTTTGVTEGICFCCPDCCYYFIKGNEPCDKGRDIEKTAATCTSCGACVEVCYFGARHVEEGILKIDPTKCFGCGLCVAVCPEGSITMVRRPT